MTRQCTCHPFDNPPTPCAQKYALTECRRATLECYPDDWPQLACAVADALDDLVKEVELSGVALAEDRVHLGEALMAAREALSRISINK